MQIKTIDLQLETLSDVFAFIDDWYDLAAVIGVQPRTLSYILRNKRQHEPGSPESVYKLWRDGDRVGYYSTKSLKFVQQRMMPLLSSIYSLFAHDHIWSYMQGVRVSEKLAELVKRKYIIKFDIKKYYDNITFAHIKETLMHYGFTERGAKLVTRYLTVKRPVGRPLTTLQQGSPISPMVSNIVGNYLFDAPLLAWLEDQKAAYPRLDARYHRFSDNFLISLDGEIPMEFIHSLQAKVTEVIRKAGFEYHKWQAVPNNHPKSNQKFLGLVLNHTLRIDKHLLDCWQATLFNACVKGLSPAAVVYWQDNPAWQLEDFSYAFGSEADKWKIEKFLNTMGGKIAYIKNINAGHYKALHKLLNAARLLHHVQDLAYVVDDDADITAAYLHKLRPRAFEQIKNYRNDAQDEETFLKGLLQALLQDGVQADLLQMMLSKTSFEPLFEKVAKPAKGAEKKTAAKRVKKARKRQPAMARAS